MTARQQTQARPATSGDLTPKATSGSATATLTKGTAKSGTRQEANGAVRSPGQPEAHLVALRDIKTTAPLPFADVRGRRISAPDGDVVGSITHVLIEREGDVVPRYLKVELDPSRRTDTKGQPASILVPVGLVRVIDDKQPVQLALPDASAWKTMQMADAEVPSWDSEVALAKQYGLATTPASPRELYANPMFATNTLSSRQLPH